MVAQPLQLNASGGVRVVWTPASFLNNPAIYNPVAVFNQLSEGIRFQLVAYNEAGCSDTAYLRVKVFDKSNFVYMPTGFTPNADGLNDVLRPTLAGVQRLEDFSIYNRYGQLVFRTQTPGKGWDGKMNAIAQMPGTYVWMVSVVTYDNQRLTTKGTTTLVR
jgi:gliding motility-associated-like protein